MAQSKKKQPRVQIMTVSPQTAENWLTRNHERQRRLSASRVEQYADDMRNGRWKLGTQVVAFNQKKELVNGQTTLHAVMKSGATIRVIVLWNMPNDAIVVLDSGQKRSTDQSFHIAGFGYVRGVGATVRRILSGIGGKAPAPISDLRVQEFMEKYEGHVEFAHHLTTHRSFKNSSIRAVLARASIGGADRERLKRFYEVVATGIMANKVEQSAVQFRNVMLDAKNRSESFSDRSEVYRKFEMALHWFLNGRIEPRLNAATQEMFPIPGEKVKEAKP